MDFYEFLCFYMFFYVFWKCSKNPVCTHWENDLRFHKNSKYVFNIFKIYTLCSPRKLRVIHFLSKITKITKIITILFGKTTKNVKMQKYNKLWSSKKGMVRDAFSDFVPLITVAKGAELRFLRSSEFYGRELVKPQICSHFLHRTLSRWGASTDHPRAGRNCMDAGEMVGFFLANDLSKVSIKLQFELQFELQFKLQLSVSD